MTLPGSSGETVHTPCVRLISKITEALFAAPEFSFSFSCFLLFDCFVDLQLRVTELSRKCIEPSVKVSPLKDMIGQIPRLVSDCALPPSSIG